MEKNYLILHPTLAPLDKEQELAILFLDIRNFTGLMESQPSQLLADDQAIVRHQMVKLQGISQGQQVRLAGKPYSAQQNLDYLLAISG